MKNLDFRSIFSFFIKRVLPAIVLFTTIISVILIASVGWSQETRSPLIKECALVLILLICGAVFLFCLILSYGYWITEDTVWFGCVYKHRLKSDRIQKTIDHRWHGIRFLRIYYTGGESISHTDRFIKVNLPFPSSAFLKDYERKIGPITSHALVTKLITDKNL
jgi:hypothetical protein